MQKLTPVLVRGCLGVRTGGIGKRKALRRARDAEGLKKEAGAHCRMDPGHAP